VPQRSTEPQVEIAARHRARPLGLRPGGLVLMGLLLLALGACRDEAPSSGRRLLKGSARDGLAPRAGRDARKALAPMTGAHFSLRGPAPRRSRWRVRIETSAGPVPAARFRDEVRRALDKWRVALATVAGPELLETAAGAEADLVIGWSDEAHETSALFHPVHEALARTAPLGETSWIRLDPRLSWEGEGQPRVYPVVLHELGHVFGLGHSLDEMAVMHASYDPRRDELNRSDRAALAAAFDHRGRDEAGLRRFVLHESEAKGGRRRWLQLAGPDDQEGGPRAALVDLDRDGRPGVLVWHVSGKAAREFWTLYRPGPRGWQATEGPVTAALALGDRGLFDLDQKGRLFAVRFDDAGRWARLRFDGDPLWGELAAQGAFSLSCGLRDPRGRGRFEKPLPQLADIWPPRADDGRRIVMPEARGAAAPPWWLTTE
jgi:Matrixin